MGITHSSNPPALGDAMKLALDGFMNAGSDIESLIWSVYLFANGKNVVGITPFEIIPDFQEAYAQIYTFGLNSDEITENSLQQIAEETTGEYRFVSNQKDLLTAIENADQASSPTVDVNIKIGWDLVTNTKNIPVYVDSSLGQLKVTLSYLGDLTSATLTMTDPSGNSHPLPYTDCEIFENEFGKESYCETHIENPVEGDWNLKVVSNLPELDLLYWWCS